MAIKAKLLPRWPADVSATAPIVATKANGAVALSYNSSTLPQVSSPTGAGRVVVREGTVYNEVPALNIAFPTIANNNLIGNVSGSTAAPAAITGAQANAVLPAFTGDTGSGGVKGLVPAPSAGDAAAGRFLKADGTFAVPSGAVSSVAGRTGAVTLDGTDVSFTQAGAAAVTRNVTTRLRDTVSIFDFMTTAEISDVTSRTASVDVAGKINSAIAQVATGTHILCPSGAYRIASSITLNRGVTLVGEGTISTLQPNTRYGTEFKWYGAVASMVNLGGFGTVYTGGGLWNIGLVGNSGASIANYGIYTKDIQGFELRNVSITSCSVAGLLFTNTAGQDPTGFGLLENVRIQLRGGATNSATGILIDGVGTGTDGVTISKAINVRIEHANGAGVEVRAIGDAWTWIGLKTFRADVETGIGVWFSTASTTSVCGFHTFLHPIVTAGFRFDTPGQHIGTQIINADQLDMNTGAVTLYGTGCQDVMMNTQTGAQYGLSVLTPSLFTSPEHDTMRFIRYDSANNIVFTHMMAWRTILTGTPSIVAGGGAGGALSLYTGAVIGNRTTIADVDALNADGWYDLQYPIAQCMVYFVTGSNVIYRIGWMDGVGATPTNGCYIELDPSVNSGNFQLVTRKAGVETRVNASVGASAFLDLKFQFQANQFVVFYRTSGNKNHARLTISTTNVPTVNMGWAYSVETKAASAARLDIYAHRVGAINEQMFS